jgi:transglutaminase-like putative cysteine protease
VYIAILRMAGIPARYTVGMMQGEGESHAWAEANCNGYWYGIDPTNALLINESYIKISHGRDYGDCMISRGIFSNPRAVQTMKVGVSVCPRQN